ncbi:hypothetical protein DL764_003712 [Monosporascus ibericus]|uniref:Uncharacterized protein n=1 Tax=Monosporascus ibericus TaxID=155417 RepID=A0A4Q4TFD9_9PEZI|nr:hypothetical protein DL764_003712 [Monosporascus ibericus]
MPRRARGHYSGTATTRTKRARASAAQDEVEQAIRQKKRKLEQPPAPIYRDKFFAYSQKRSTRAYDDRLPAKRRKTSKSDRRLPKGFEKPSRLPDDSMIFAAGSTAHLTFGMPRHRLATAMVPRALRRRSRDHDPIASMGAFGRLPAEIRDKVFREVLVWPRDIRVLRGWTLVFPRQRPRLAAGLALLRTCEVLRLQGTRILYGENTFLYLIRDPSDAHPATRPVLRGVYGNSVIPVDRYGHLIRRVKVVVEANRMCGREYRDNFIKAVTKFEGGLAIPATLRTITIEVPALTAVDLGNGGDPLHVPICNFFGGDRSRVLSALKKINVQYIRVLATDRTARLFEGRIDMRYYASQKYNKNRGEDSAVGDDVMMNTRKTNAAKAEARLNSLPYNLQLLALDSEEAIRPRRFWTRIQREEEPVFEEQRLDEDRPESVIASPTPQPRRRLMSRKRLTEQWLEDKDSKIETRSEFGLSDASTPPPADDLEVILSESKPVTAAPAKKKYTNVQIDIAPKKAATTKTKQDGKDNDVRVTPPVTEGDIIRMSQKADRLSKEAASSVAALKAYRIAAEQKKAAREAAAAAAAAATANCGGDGETAAASGGPSQCAERQGTHQQDLEEDAENAGDYTEEGAEEYAEDTVATAQPHEVDEEIQTECESIISEEP